MSFLDRLTAKFPVLPSTAISEFEQAADVMKKLEAIIKPFKLEDVRQALADIGVDAMTLSDVKGYGHQTSHTELYRDAAYQVDFLPRIKVEVVLADEMLDQAVNAITRAARTGKSGDGKVFVFPLERVIRIRTEESGLAAV